MPVLAYQLLLLTSAAALLAAAYRVVSPAESQGLMRLIAAVTVAAGLAVLESLGLGLVGLGGCPAALVLAAVATWACVVVLFPAPRISPLTEPLAWWREQQAVTRLGTAALAGAFVVFCAWLLRYPALGFDAVTHELSGVLVWLDDGSPGAAVKSYYEIPTEAYPATKDVLLGWSTALSDSFIPATLAPPLAGLLLAVAGWAGLRERRVPPLVAGLAVATLITLPISIRSLGRLDSDLPAAAWLACSGALAAATVRSPALAAPCLLAAGLAVGTKTTVLPLALLCSGLAIFMVARRGLLRTLAPTLLLAVGGALAVGGLWFIRNTVNYGSPFWPFLPGPAGDPMPPLIQALNHSLLERPRATLDGRVSVYRQELRGALVLAPAAVLLPLVVRSREARLAALVTAISVLLWASAPLTGVGDVPNLPDLSVSALRYVLPALVAAAVALALASREPGRILAVVIATFLLAIVANLVGDLPSSFPVTPSAVTLLTGAALGGALACLAAPLRQVSPRALGAVTAFSLGLLILLPALAVDGYIERHVRVGATIHGGLLEWFDRRGALDGSGVNIAMASTRPATLAGERLENSLELIPEHESCAAVDARRQDGYVVLVDFESEPYPGGEFPVVGPSRCIRVMRGAARAGPFVIYRPRR